MRTIIDLPEEQRRELDAYCLAEHVSRAEAVRRAVQILLDEPERRRKERKAALDAVFGIWADRDIDSVEYVRELRTEWDRDWDP